MRRHFEVTIVSDAVFETFSLDLEVAEQNGTVFFSSEFELVGSWFECHFSLIGMNLPVFEGELGYHLSVKE